MLPIKSFVLAITLLVNLQLLIELRHKHFIRTLNRIFSGLSVLKIAAYLNFMSSCVNLSFTALWAENHAEKWHSENLVMSWDLKRIHALQTQKGYLTQKTTRDGLFRAEGFKYFQFFIQEDNYYNKWLIMFSVVPEDMSIIKENIWKYGDLFVLDHVSENLFYATNLRTSTTVLVSFSNVYNPPRDDDGGWEGY